MRFKKLTFLFVGLLVLTFSMTDCKKSDSNSCVDKNLLINKWWYNIIPAGSGVTYTSFYYESTGRLKTKEQDGTGEKYVGTWAMSDGCKKLNMVDSSSATPVYTEEITELSAHKLKVTDTWSGFGSFPSEFRDTP